ncbi:MAG TPA: pilus assembly protein TadG-related protein, partial [Thermomicrobiales bacterium]|nr:pilus assembly protein TadG-related protein [Thermomicrobiales bacterium]
MKYLLVMRRDWVRPRSGQTLIIFALISLVLMGVLGLVLDAGYDFGMRRQMQNAADAAALAGVRALTMNVTSNAVLPTVQQVAQQNGVANPSDSAQLTCTVLKGDGTDYGPCGTATYATGTDVSGVRVTVHESHPTFVLKALGIATSNTGATATAQVTVMTKLANNQAPFLICGINTQVVDATRQNNVIGQQNILVTNGQYTFFNGTTYTPYPATSEPPAVNPSAYAVTAGGQPLDSSGNPMNLPSLSSLPNNNLGPRFLIQTGNGGPGSIAPCTANASSFKGYNPLAGQGGYIDITKTLYFTAQPPTYPNGYIYPGTSNNALGPQSTSGNATQGNGDVSQAGMGQQAGPASNVPGAGGCVGGQDPNNCVLFIPVLDYSVAGTAVTNG